MRVLLDTNIVLDLLLAREPFLQSAKEIFLMVENRIIEGFLSATSIVTLHYLIGKQNGRDEANRVIEDLLELFEITPVDKDILLKASANNGTDYEDSVIYTAAEKNSVDIIVSRDTKGFKRSKVAVMMPDTFLAGVKIGKLH